MIKECLSHLILLICLVRLAGKLCVCVKKETLLKELPVLKLIIIFFFFANLICLVCQRQSHSITNPELSHKVFTSSMVDDQSNTLQINRGSRLPPTRIFYSTIANNFNPNQNPPVVQPTFPTSLISRGNDRRRKAPRKSFKNRKFCLSCLTDFKTKIYSLNDFCLNPLMNVTEAELRFLNMCPETSQFCQTEVYTVNGVLSGLERRCSTLCTPLCFQRFVFAYPFFFFVYYILYKRVIVKDLLDLDKV